MGNRSLGGIALCLFLILFGAMALVPALRIDILTVVDGVLAIAAGILILAGK